MYNRNIRFRVLGNKKILLEVGSMVTRAELKTRARNALGDQIFGNKWMRAVLVVIVIAGIEGILSAITKRGEYVSAAFVSILNLLIAGPFAGSMAYIFTKQARDHESIDIADVFYGFKEGRFGGNFILAFFIGLFTFLWSLLFVIPGIVKALAYSQAFYIHNDHPEKSWQECMDDSQEMMRGHKWEYFVLCLSFLGWFIIGILCLAVGTLWVEAYSTATMAEYYLELKEGFDPEPVKAAPTADFAATPAKADEELPVVTDAEIVSEGRKLDEE